MLAKALPDLCHGILARLLALVEVRPPRCNMQHGHESHGCNDGRRSTPEFFHGLHAGCDHLRRDDCLRPSLLKTPSLPSASMTADLGPTIAHRQRNFEISV